jgi:activator of Hsp90 ATPase-like protein
MSSSVQSIENLTLNLTQEIHVSASLDATFAALLEEMGPRNETPEGKPLPMKIEARPGGRWYRDLGEDNGHFWGLVQAIKRPTLLEISGPLFMSSAVISNLQYRLSDVDGGTLIAFRHTAFGFIPDDYKEGMSKGWTHLLARVRKKAEAPGSARRAGRGAER